MIRYGICVNIDDDCPKAKSSEVISIDGAKEFICPDCGHTLFDVQKPSSQRPKWLVPALITGLLCLFIGLVWIFWPHKEPLMIKVLGLDCETGVLSLTTTGGNGDSVTYKVAGIGQAQLTNVFTIPDSLRHDSILLVHAAQGENIIDTTFATSCVTTPEPVTITVGGGQSTTGLTVSKTKLNPIIVWTRVPNSEFCDDLTECIQVYSEKNNLGQTRERRIENCAECAKAKAGN